MQKINNIRESLSVYAEKCVEQNIIITIHGSKISKACNEPDDSEIFMAGNSDINTHFSLASTNKHHI